METETILISGACGQIGSELTLALREKGYNVVATDLKEPTDELRSSGTFERLDILSKTAVADIIQKYKVTQIYHLAALLSATGEQNPELAWRVNMKGLRNVLDLAVEYKLNKVFFPSSIAVFGPTTPKDNTPQYTVCEPNTIYGISKYAGERWCDYYFQKKGLDVRSLRYPGLISYKTKAGGGTTDYAVDIFFEAQEKKIYTCFLKEDSILPMMYMPDAIRATIELMEAPKEKIKVRSSYNIAAFSFSPKELAIEIQKEIPDFKIDYKPDYRQQIADSWTRSIDDSYARENWGWEPEFSLSEMVHDMLTHIPATV